MKKYTSNAEHWYVEGQWDKKNFRRRGNEPSQVNINKYWSEVNKLFVNHLIKEQLVVILITTTGTNNSHTYIS